MIKTQCGMANFNPLEKEGRKEGRKGGRNKERKEERERERKKGGTEEESLSIKYDHLNVLVK